MGDLDQVVNDEVVRPSQNPETNKIMTALVVDDDRTTQRLHRILLQNLDIENEVVGNGREAIDVHIAGKSFDLIIMDMDMPIMNGIDVRIFINFGHQFCCFKFLFVHYFVKFY